MKKFLDFIKQGWFLSLLGVIVVSVILYFVMPLVFTDSSTALIATIAGIALLIIGWMGFQLLGIVLSRKKNEQILDSLQEHDEQQDTANEEIGVLKDRLSQAIAELKNSKIGGKGGKSNYLYQLPWYIIIGPPASGKTTLLKNSSLKTALSEKFGRDSVAGIGGTRHCDWWFAEDAVLLDTAGRYTTQDSNAVTDKQAWLGFLNLLKKNRTRRPLNGVLIAISMSDLLTSNDIHQHAAEIRKRLQELYEQFNLKLPVYLIFTKADQLAGFSEFFDDLDRDARAQVWGTTFTRENKVIKEGLPQLKQELDLLEEQLKNKLILKLEKESDIERRKKIYTFPEQFHAIKNSVDSFVNEVFAPSRYQHKIFLRGVYLTSAEQTGSPIDKLLNSMAHTFGFERFNSPNFRAKGKSFFIDHLLQKVVFPEAELAGLNPTYEKRKWIVQWGTVGIAVVALMVGTGLWLTSYLRNSGTIGQLSVNFDVLKASAEQNSGTADLRKSLDILNKANPLFQSDDSIWATFGLSQQKRLTDQTARTYNQVLQVELLPHVLKTLEAQLRNNTQDKKALFSTLKAYLLFMHDDHFKQQKNLLRALVVSTWEKQPYSPEERQQLTSHLDALLSISPKPVLSMANLVLDNTLIDSTRNILSKVSSSTLVYEQVKFEIINDSADPLPGFVLSGARGKVANADDVFEKTNEIEGIFTYKGYNTFKHKAPKLIEEFMANNWVMGDAININQAALSDEVAALYFADYKGKWEDFLNSIAIRTPTDFMAASRILNALSSSPSPLTSLLTAVANETNLNKPMSEEETRAAREAEQKLIQMTGALGSTASNIMGKNALQKFMGNSNGTDPVTTGFAGIQTLAQPNNAAMQRIVDSFRALSVKLGEVDSAMPQEKSDKLLQTKKALDEINSAFANQPDAVKHSFAGIGGAVLKLLGERGTATKNSSWASQVYGTFQSKIQGKYPLAGSPGSNEIPLGDFAEFFGPNGTLDKYFQENLVNRVDRSQKAWKSADTLSPISTGALQQLQMAEQIRSAFFPGGTLGIKFSIKPESIPPNIAKVALNISGTESSFSNPPKPATVQWPGQDGSGFVGLDITTIDGITTSLSSEGQWALIDMFTQKGSFQETGTNSYQVTFPLEGGSITFKVDVARTDNLFNAVKQLRSFKCPPDLGK